MGRDDVCDSSGKSSDGRDDGALVKMELRIGVEVVIIGNSVIQTMVGWRRGCHCDDGNV